MEVDPSTDDGDPVSGARAGALRPIMVALTTTVFLSSLNQTMVVLALPDIVADFATLAEVSWVVTAYLVTSTVLVPLWGKLSDTHGRRRMFQLAMLAFALGSAGAGVAWSIEPLVLARAVQGAGGGGILALSHAILGDVVLPRQRSGYLARLVSVGAVAGIVGPLLGGVIVDQLSWRWVFLLNLPFVAVAFWLVRRLIMGPRPTRRPADVDWRGALSLSVSVVALITLTSASGTPEMSWWSPRSLLLGAAAIVGLIAFLYTERRVEEPLIPPELFRDRTFAVTIVLGVIVGATMHGALFMLPLLLQAALGQSATSSGVWLLPLVAGFVSATLVSGHLISRWGRYRAFPLLGTTCMAAGLFILSLTTPGGNPVWPLVAMGMLGVGNGSLMHVLTLVAQNSAPAAHLGAATSTAKFSRSLGAATGVAAVGTIVAIRFRSGSEAAFDVSRGIEAALAEATTRASATAASAIHQAVADAIGFTFLVLCVLALVGLAVASLLQERPLSASTGEGDDRERLEATADPRAYDV